MDISRLWEAYRQNKNADNRNQLLIEYAPLVKRVVRMLPFTYMGYADENDMIEEGVFGLMDAIEKFDSRRNVKFETYASLRIRGAILDKMRKMDILSRNTRDKIKLIEEKTDVLEKRLHRSPTSREITNETGLSEKTIRKTMGNAVLSNMVSLEEVIRNGGGLDNTESAATPEEAYQQKETKEMLVCAVNELKDKEKKVISLYYYEELTLREIGSVLGVSESRISQILSKTLLKLKEKIIFI